MKINKEEIYKNLSIKYNLPIKVIEQICVSPYKLLLDAIRVMELKRKGTWFSLRIKYLGIFVPNPYKIKNTLKRRTERWKKNLLERLNSGREKSNPT